MAAQPDNDGQGRGVSRADEADDPPEPVREALLALLDEGAPLGDRLRRMQTYLAESDGVQAQGALSASTLAQVLAALAVAHARERADLAAQLQKAQFLAQHFRPIAPPQADRLEGDARAMGQLLGQAMRALPRRQRRTFLDATAYLEANPDVAAAGADPLQHYISSGAAEGRAPADLRRRCPEAYATQVYPGTLAELVRSKRPGFTEEFPASLRHAALSVAARDGRAISVVLPSWNSGHVLARAVSSALLQSRAPFEVIVVDDGSTDGTPDLLRAQFPEPLADGRLVLITGPHAGVSAARNTGLAAARGEIIAYLDSDNIWELDHLLFACAGLWPEAAPQTGAAPRMTYTALCRHNLPDSWSDILFRPFERAALEAENYIDLNSFVHERVLFETLGGFDTGLTRFVDWDLILRYSRNAVPAAVPVVTGHYFLVGAETMSITRDEPAAPNLARIRARLAREAET